MTFWSFSTSCQRFFYSFGYPVSNLQLLSVSLLTIRFSSTKGLAVCTFKMDYSSSYSNGNSKECPTYVRTCQARSKTPQVYRTLGGNDN